MDRVVAVAVILMLAGCAHVAPKADDECGGNHRPVPIIEVK